MGEKTTKSRMHRFWTFVVSLIITVAAILTIVVIATIGSKASSNNEQKPIEEPTTISNTPEVTPETHPIDTPTSNSSNTSSNSANTGSSTSNPKSSSSNKSGKGSVPDTGPSDVIGLALLAGSIVAYLTSLRMVKAKSF